MGKRQNGQRSSLSDYRKMIADMKPPANALEGVTHSDTHIFFDKTVSILTRRYFPLQETHLCPTIFYIPGNAFIASETLYSDMICSRLAEKSKSQVILIAPPLAPEHQAHKPISYTYRAFSWLLDHAERFNIDKTKIALAGYSSGGNIAACIAIQALANKISFSMQILISPLTNLLRNSDTFCKEEEQDEVISESYVNWFLNNYVPDRSQREDPSLSPSFEKLDNLRGLPQTLIYVSQFDRFRSDAEDYYSQLNQAGVTTHKQVFSKEKEKMDHSYLWKDPNISSTIGNDVAVAWGLKPIPQFFSKITDHTTFFSAKIKSSCIAESGVAKIRSNKDFNSTTTFGKGIRNPDSQHLNMCDLQAYSNITTPSKPSFTQHQTSSASTTTFQPIKKRKIAELLSLNESDNNSSVTGSHALDENPCKVMKYSNLLNDPFPNDDPIIDILLTDIIEKQEGPDSETRYNMLIENEKDQITLEDYMQIEEPICFLKSDEETAQSLQQASNNAAFPITLGTYNNTPFLFFEKSQSYIPDMMQRKLTRRTMQFFEPSQIEISLVHTPPPSPQNPCFSAETYISSPRTPSSSPRTPSSSPRTPSSSPRTPSSSPRTPSSSPRTPSSSPRTRTGRIAHMATGSPSSSSPVVSSPTRFRTN
ncbi:MAG: alpha/beta hydrolase fold domain-containing protein [Legionellales bacterium]|nr:alpha/beta hydrolase fold domain-containing protein [Legionellales bacterium]